MNSQVKIVKRNEASETKQSAGDAKGTELGRNREMVAIVKSWIDEFNLRNSQQLVTLSLPHKA